MSCFDVYSPVYSCQGSNPPGDSPQCFRPAKGAAGRKYIGQGNEHSTGVKPSSMAHAPWRLITSAADMWGVTVVTVQCWLLNGLSMMNPNQIYYINSLYMYLCKNDLGRSTQYR